MTEESLGRRLRRERERRQIPLSSISANTKISVALFEGLERGDVSRWPTGIFRRAFVRAYAQGIGLDPDVVVREFLERFPDPTESLPAAPLPAPCSTLAPVAAAPRLPAAETALRMTLADADVTLNDSRLPRHNQWRWGAVACDAAFVTAVAAGLFVVSGSFWMPFGIAMLAYYWGGTLALGGTPGVFLWTRAAKTAGSPSRAAIARMKTIKALDALLVHFSRAAANPEPPAALQSEPRASRS